MSLLAVAGTNSAVAGGYDIDNSLKFESDNSEKLYYTLSSNGDLQQMSFSCWVKRTELGSEQAIFTGRLGASGEFGRLIFSPSDTIQFWMRDSGNITVVQLYTNRVFRDTSAWYHIVFGIDTTQATASDRANLYINGVKETSFSSETYPTLNASAVCGFNRNTFNHVLGVEEANNTYFNGYIAEAHFVDGQQLAASDFGEFDNDTGIWKPKAYTGSYGTNGFYLDFENSASLGADGSGNSNNFTLSNITSADQATDTPTNNFATYNILNPTYGSCVINEGATQIEGDSTGSFRNVQSTLAVTSGKWYCELVPQLASTMNTSFGVVNLDTAIFDTTWYNNAGYWGGNFDTGASIYFYTNGGGAGSEAVSFGGTVGLAFDADNGTLDFYLNGSHQEQFTGIPSGTFAFFADVQGTGNPYIRFNFGGYTVNTIASAASDANGYGNFEYAPPSGYYALCSKNLAEFG